ncbi:MFS transporter [Candidatus Pacearchaeota archaeon]|nr:MFS transporter [Candidatus Pacearchaeota archaeon]
MAFFKKNELKLLWPFYLESISKILLILPAFMIIYFMNLGFSLFQIGLLLAVWPLFALLFEIPTGAIADIYGRKTSVLLGIFLQGIILLLFYFTQNYIIILILMGFLGTFSTLVSGANKAWVTDLINKKNKKLLHDYFSKSMSFRSVGFVISGLIGVLVVKSFGINIIWIITSFGFFLSFFIMLFGKEEYIKKKTNLKNPFKKINKKTITSIKYSFKKKVLFYILIAGLILTFASSFNAIISWTPLLKSLGYPDYAFGYLISLIALVGVVAPLISRRFVKNNNERKIITTFLIGLMIFSLLFIFTNNIIFTFFVIFGASFFIYSIYPTWTVYLQKFIPSKFRATINSIDSMLVSLAVIIALPIAGLLLDLIGPRITIFISGIIMIPVIIIFLKLKD